MNYPNAIAAANMSFDRSAGSPFLNLIDDSKVEPIAAPGQLNRYAL
jgi:hypothetical protein